jgi:transglutaminase-like putative cysteine protease
MPRSVAAARVAACVLALLAVSVGGPAPAAAGQLDRQVERAGGEVRFTVRFRDAERRTRVVSFALPADAYAKARHGLTPVDAPEVERRIDRRVQALLADSRTEWRRGMRDRLAALAASLPDGISMDYSFDGAQLTWSLEARGVDRSALQAEARRIETHLERASHRLNAQRQRALDRKARRAQDAVLRDLNYVRDPDLGGLLRPDYAALAQAQSGLLRPLAEAIARTAGAGVRARTGLALAFLQTIPYDRLQKRGAADGTGFAVPAELLHLNRGDCDSKATALAALMRHFAPEVATALLLLPGHAVLAAELPTKPGDRTVELAGRRLVLMEPAGPATAPIGRIADDSRRLLDRGKLQSVVWMTGGPGDGA